MKLKYLKIELYIFFEIVFISNLVSNVVHYLYVLYTY
jgi:hypothetical protein